MKRLVKIVASVLGSAILLLLLVKRESFLEAHYDTSERRNIMRISLLGIRLSESLAWTKGGYREQYQKIFGSQPSDTRWHSVSRRPIVSSQLFTEYHQSVMTPPAVSLRDSLVGRIFERYERDQSTERAKEAFTDLEALLPSTEQLGSLNQEEVRAVRDKAKKIPSLQDLIN